MIFHHLGDTAILDAPIPMIELKQHRISLTAIDARVACEEF